VGITVEVVLSCFLALGLGFRCATRPLQGNRQLAMGIGKVRVVGQGFLVTRNGIRDLTFFQQHVAGIGSKGCSLVIHGHPSKIGCGFPLGGGLWLPRSSCTVTASGVSERVRSNEELL
jgi:hypothetical protein